MWTRARRFFIAALALSLPLSLGAGNVALVGLSACLVAERLFGRGKPWGPTLKSPVILALAAYALWGIADSFFGLDPSRSLAFVIRNRHVHMLWTAAALLIAFSEDPFPGAWSFIALGLGSVLLAARWPLFATGPTALLGLLSVFPSSSHGFTLTYLKGFHGQIAALAALLGLFLLGDKGQSSARGAKRTAAWLLCAGGFLVLFLSRNQERSGWLGAVVAIAAALPLAAERRRFFAKAAAVVAVALVAVAAARPDHFLASAMRAIGHGAVVAERPDQSNADQTRLTMLGIGWAMFKDRPFLGVGPDRFGQALPRYAAFRPEGWVWHDPLDTYLNELATQGWPGLFLFAAFLAALGFHAFRRARARPCSGTLMAWGLSAAYPLWLAVLLHFQYETTLFLLLWSWGQAQGAEGETSRG